MRQVRSAGIRCRRHGVDRVRTSNTLDLRRKCAGQLRISYRPQKTRMAHAHLPRISCGFGPSAFIASSASSGKGQTPSIRVSASAASVYKCGRPRLHRRTVSSSSSSSARLRSRSYKLCDLRRYTRPGVRDVGHEQPSYCVIVMGGRRDHAVAVYLPAVVVQQSV